MPAITAKEKKHAIGQLISDTIKDRVVELRHDTELHWREVMTEIFDEQTIRSNNDVLMSMMNNQDILSITTSTSRYDSVNFCDKDARIKKVTVIHPNNRIDPIGVRYDIVHGNSSAHSNIIDIWSNAAPNTELKLTQVMFSITADDVPTDSGSSCALTDPDEYRDDIEVVELDEISFIEECRTVRAFKERAKQISTDINKLEETLENATRNCRTDTNLIKTIPELEKYINPDVPANLGSLLSSIHKG